MKPEELIKQLKIEKDCAYLIFVSANTNLSKHDLAKIDLKKLGADKNSYFVRAYGNMAELIKPVRIKNGKIESV